MTTVTELPVAFASPPPESESDPGRPIEPVTPLMRACQQEDDQEVRTILSSQPAAARDRDRTRKTALHYCADSSSTGSAERLLSAAPDLVNAADEDGYTPLHLAVISGNRALLKLLLRRGADIQALDHERHSAIHWATVCGELDIMDILLEAGANPSTADIHGAYPIHYAAQMCGPNSEIGSDVQVGLLALKKLIAHGVDVSVRDHDGREALLWAASAETRPSKIYCPSGSPDALVALVNAGASVTAEDKDGLTALHCAASRGHTDCIDTLITLCGAEVDVADHNGCTPLFYAVTLGHADCTELLLKCGADPNRQDRKGRTPAHCGAAKGQIETVRMLARHNANLWIRNAKGDQALHESVQSGRKELVTWLLHHRPEAVNNPNNDGRCPLHVAAIHNNIEMCKVLMDLHAHVNPIMRSSKGQLMTPLDSALYRGSRGCAKYLQLHGGAPASTLTDRQGLMKALSHSALSQSQTENAFVLPPETYMHLHLSPDGLNSSLSSYRRSGPSALGPTPVSDGVQTDRRDTEHAGIQVKMSGRHQRSLSADDDGGGAWWRDRETTTRRSGETDSGREDSGHGGDRRAARLVREEDEEDIQNVEVVRRRLRRELNTRYIDERYDSAEEDPERRGGRRRRHSDDGRRRRQTSDGGRRRRRRSRESDGSDRLVDSRNQRRRNHSEDGRGSHRRRHSDGRRRSYGDEDGYSGEESTYRRTRSNEVEREHRGGRRKSKRDHSKEERHSDHRETHRGSHSEGGDATRERSDINQDSRRENHSDYESTPRNGRRASDERRPHRVRNNNKEASDDRRSRHDDSRDKRDSRVEREARAGRLSVSDTESSRHRARDLHETEEKDASEAEVDTGRDSAERRRRRRRRKPRTSGSDGATSSDEGADTQPRQRQARTGAERRRRPADSKTAPPRKGRHRTADGSATNGSARDDSDGASPTRADSGIASVERAAGGAPPRPARTGFGSDGDTAANQKVQVVDGRRKGVVEPQPPLAAVKVIGRAPGQEINRGPRPMAEILPTTSADTSSHPTPRGSGVRPSQNGLPRQQQVKVDKDFKQMQKVGTLERDLSRLAAAQLEHGKTGKAATEDNSDDRAHRMQAEKKIFQDLLELKRVQMRLNKTNEEAFVKRLAENFNASVIKLSLASFKGPYTYTAYEEYLSDQLKQLQVPAKRRASRLRRAEELARQQRTLERAKNSVKDEELRRALQTGGEGCHHAAHAYTGIPCVAYITKNNHHGVPKASTKTILPKINPSTRLPEPVDLRSYDPTKPLRLELNHGGQRQMLELPTQLLDKNKKYHVSFSIRPKDGDGSSASGKGEQLAGDGKGDAEKTVERKEGQSKAKSGEKSSARRATLSDSEAAREVRSRDETASNSAPGAPDRSAQAASL